jgi:integrase
MGKLSGKLDANIVINLVKTLENREKAIFWILFESGCKVSELVDLRFSDFKEDSVEIDGRTVKISRSLCSFVSKLLCDNVSDYLFSSRQSLKLTTKRVRQIVESCSRKLVGFRILPEDIRKLSIKEKLKKKSVEEVKSEAGIKRLDKRKYLSLEDLEKFKSVISSQRDYLMFSLLFSGLKSSRIAKLKVSDINHLGISKTLFHRLEKYSQENSLSSEDYLFLTRQETILTKERIFQIITTLGRAAKVEVSPRILNNTAIAAALSSSDSSKFDGLGLKNRAFHLMASFENG